MGISNFQGQGPNYVPAYQTSGTPFVSSSVAPGTNIGPIRIKFPYVTKTLTISNLDDDMDLRVAFTHSGSFKAKESTPGGGSKPSTDGDNFFLLQHRGAATTPGSSVMTLDVRCTEVWFMANHATNTVQFSCYAGLTGIAKDQFPVLSASNGFEGTG